jgi:hypothetical protein
MCTRDHPQPRACRTTLEYAAAMLRFGVAASLVGALLWLPSAVAAPQPRSGGPTAVLAATHLLAVPVSPPVGLLGVETRPVISLRPQRNLPRGSYYYAVAVLVHYRTRGQPRPYAPACAVSSDMALTQYGRPGGSRALGLTLLPAPGAGGRWCAKGNYEGAVYAVPHRPPCSRYYPCYGRGSCGPLGGFCGVVVSPEGEYSYPGGLPRPIDPSSRIVGRFKLQFGGTLGEEGGIAPSLAAELLSLARREALANGEGHPYDIEAVSTTFAGASRAEGSYTVSPSAGSQPVYLVAMRGRFSCGTCKVPAGARAPTGTVLTLTLTAPGLLRGGFGLGPDYPEMRVAGTPLRLG